jgi:hypothetical protein
MSLLSGSNKKDKKGGKSTNGKPNQQNQPTPKPGKAANFSKKMVKTGGSRGS